MNGAEQLHDFLNRLLGEPWYWAVYNPNLTAEGYAPTAREAMQRADNAYQEKA